MSYEDKKKSNIFKFLPETNHVEVVEEKIETEISPDLVESFDANLKHYAGNKVLNETVSGMSKDSIFKFEYSLEEGTKSVSSPGFDADKETDKLMNHPRFDNHLGYAVKAAQKRKDKGTYDHELFKKGLQTTVGFYGKYNAEEKRQLASKVGDTLAKKHGFVNESVELEEGKTDWVKQAFKEYEAEKPKVKLAKDHEDSVRLKSNEGIKSKTDAHTAATKAARTVKGKGYGTKDVSDDEENSQQDHPTPTQAKTFDATAVLKAFGLSKVPEAPRGAAKTVKGRDTVDKEAAGEASPKPGQNQEIGKGANPEDLAVRIHTQLHGATRAVLGIDHIRAALARGMSGSSIIGMSRSATGRKQLRGLKEEIELDEAFKSSAVSVNHPAHGQVRAKNKEELDKKISKLDDAKLAKLAKAAQPKAPRAKKPSESDKVTANHYYSAFDSVPDLDPHDAVAKVAKKVGISHEDAEKGMDKHAKNSGYKDFYRHYMDQVEKYHEMRESFKLEEGVSSLDENYNKAYNLGRDHALSGSKKNPPWEKGYPNDLLHKAYNMGYKDYKQKKPAKSVSESWEVNIVKEGSIHKYQILDGEDILAEGTNFSYDGALAAAVRKADQLENYVLEQVAILQEEKEYNEGQFDRVKSIIKTLVK